MSTPRRIGVPIATMHLGNEKEELIIWMTPAEWGDFVARGNALLEHINGKNSK